ncbi:unnamed protein product [Heligmosomoides polygyrus]|uniref:Senescence domain-containing protein n=1 Tax=Heligmosomoides polygyrus TaxID=6339 RepID=A0A183FVQ8_HELPZ|nr:unnamed protein product [Heligmosomoides polygyrus]
MCHPCQVERVRRRVTDVAQRAFVLTIRRHVTDVVLQASEFRKGVTDVVQQTSGFIRGATDVMQQANGRREPYVTKLESEEEKTSKGGPAIRSSKKKRVRGNLASGFERRVSDIRKHKLLGMRTVAEEPPEDRSTAQHKPMALLDGPE